MADSVEKRLRKLEKRFNKFDKNLGSLQKKTDFAIHNTNKQHSRLLSADNEDKRKIKALEIISKNTFAKANTARVDAAKISGRQQAMERSWNPAVLKKITDTIGMLNRIIADIERREAKNTRNINRVQASMLAISKHARDIEAEHTDAKFAAKELAEKAANLKETVDYFFKNTENLNNRINANAAGMTDITSAMEMMKDRLMAFENQAAQITEFNEKLEDASRNIDQLVQKVAYLEKATVKTIVLE